MVPAFKYIKIPFSVRSILRRNLRDSNRDELFIGQVINSDKATLLLVQKYLGINLRDRSVAGIYRYYGWDLFRKSLLSIYIYRAIHLTWPMVSHENTPYIDGDFNLMEEEFSMFAAKGSYRHSMLALYLRFLEAKIKHESMAESPHLAESCLKTLSLFSYKNRKGEETDLAILLYWHFLEYFKEDKMMQFLREKKSYQKITELLSPASKKIMTENICTYLYSLGDQEQFKFDVIA